ncbi:hypothetical protein J32TS6_30210 [Virgibacillus pantothenticus]|uniref:Sce7726 family protein n=2 Tax=Virgibacillus TaxID=84406 RepID=A0A0L0QLC7_VIRPA|nr:sce7726 family protein [Virgibacillus pantothenticus]KNE19371.1 hypothetical protein AFK71_12760 [Virgibacillus pantothenticus]MED3736590.1 sce7726 family protein [Virgibacillus pantothenticus]GIP64466.1 hypothetical protein J32TS6_30210 [Virgibacillus pantothenticus]SIS97714.1 hypothetical protein SAMN05421787_108185 [Virgibacillus pantothenticus]
MIYVKKLDDNEIRTALITRLSTYKDCKIYEEVTVPSGKARADIVSVNGHVVAYEIKSDYDSIKRLETQIPEYDRNFEMNYIVVGAKFEESISNFVPEYWGIILVRKTRLNTIRLSFIRKAKLNPKLSFTDFLSLLSSNEIKKIATKGKYLEKHLKSSEVRKLFKQDIVKKLDENLSNSIKKSLKKQVRLSLKS